MDKDKYVSLIEKILACKKLSVEEKKEYIRLLEIIKNMDEEKASEYEQRSYMLGKRKLTDKERLLYELNYINSKDIKDKERIIKKYAYQLNSSRTKYNYDKLKKKITRLQLANKIPPRFYSVFESMIDDATKESIDDIVIRQTRELKKTR